MSTGKPKIAIIGAGIIGLSCAWELLQRGADVTVYERQWPPRGASWAAAGMLAPAFEAACVDGAHPQLFDLCLESAALWAEFAAGLKGQTGQDVGYHASATLAVAIDEEECAKLDTLGSALDHREIEWRRPGIDKVRSLERSLGPEIEQALLLPTDGRVDSQAVLLALHAAVETAGGVCLFGEVPDRSRLADAFDATLVATGSETRELVTPVKGVMLAFRRADLPLDHVVRCGNEYAVPRGEHVLVGATIGDVPDPRAFLLSRAVRFLPRIRSAALVDQWSSARPHTPDHAPILAAMGADGGYVATGHYRNGILLAPITAKIMADMILDDRRTDLAAAFDLSRLANLR